MEGLLNIKIDIKLEIVPNIATKQIMAPETAKTQDAESPNESFVVTISNTPPALKQVSFSSALFAITNDNRKNVTFSFSSFKIKYVGSNYSYFNLCYNCNDS